MNEKQKTTLVHAINHFGVEGQINKAVEEMGELITELSRRNLQRFDREHVAEEVADALIMLEQLRIIFGGDRVDGYVAEKLERLEKTIDGDWRRQERMMPNGMVKHLEEEESEARKGSLVGECVQAGFMAGMKSIDPDLAEKVAKWMAKFPKYLCYRVDLHEDGLDPDGNLQFAISIEEVNNMLMFDGLEKPTCCRECPVREEHNTVFGCSIECRVAGGFNHQPDTIPDWCPADAVESVELIVSGLEKRSASDLASLLTKAEKFGKIGGEENGSC